MKTNQVRNFFYNGFIVNVLTGFAPWSVKSIVGWTNDPGIIRVLGTDDKEHLVPSCCLDKNLKLPVEPELKPNIVGGKGEIFGKPSKS